MIYLTAVIGGLLPGTVVPGVEPYFEALLWPVLAVLIGNFVLIPALVWLAVQMLPNDPALRLGVLLVLLAPCTDWFITFIQLGRGNTAQVIAVTPLNLLLQLLLLPIYLWLMLPATDFSTALKTEDMLPAALTLIGLLLMAAALTERWVEARPERAVWRDRLGWWPVPLLAVVAAPSGPAPGWGTRRDCPD